MTLVIVTAALDLPRTHRRQRLGPVERLNRGLLVHAQHQGAVRRIQIQPHNIAYLLDEERIVGQLKGLAGDAAARRKGS